MISLDAGAIRGTLREDVVARLFRFETFVEIESTNSYLMQQEAPPPGRASVALTDNPTMGRGRHGRIWQSPPGSGLCLSVAYTFSAQPANLPALTLAIGLGAIAALEDLGVSGVQLKWPNDLIAEDGKLGGILTETVSPDSGAISIVTGIGVNVDLGEEFDTGAETAWAHRIADLAGLVDDMPSRNALAASLIEGLYSTFVDFEAHGFKHFVRRWPGRDWLLGREVTIDTPGRRVTGVGTGIADDGALLVETGSGVVSRITSGSVTMVGISEAEE